MCISEQVFHHLKGSWKLSRTINNYKTAPDLIRVEGKAQFKEITSNYIEYREDVIITGKDIESYRDFIYKLEFGKVKVYFIENGKPSYIYNSLRFEDRGYMFAHDEHVCKLDRYRTYYFVYDRNRFDTRCKVIGPYKNYEIRTQYIKELSH